MMKPLPRVNAEDVATISGDVWNRLCDMVETSVNLQLAPPLVFDETGKGRVLRLQAAPGHILFKISGAVTDQVGRYTAKSALSAPKSDATGALVVTDIAYAWSALNNLIVWNVSEIGAVAHALTAGDDVYVGVFSGAIDKTTGLPIVILIGLAPSTSECDPDDPDNWKEDTESINESTYSGSSLCWTTSSLKVRVNFCTQQVELIKTPGTSDCYPVVDCDEIDTVSGFMGWSD